VTAWVRVLYRTLTRGGHFLGYPLCWPRWFYSRRLFACPPRQGESQPCRPPTHIDIRLARRRRASRVRRRNTASVQSLRECALLGR
jgi:hypothetical protein